MQEEQEKERARAEAQAKLETYIREKAKLETLFGDRKEALDAHIDKASAKLVAACKHKCEDNHFCNTAPPWDNHMINTNKPWPPRKMGTFAARLPRCGPPTGKITQTAGPI